MEFRLLLIPLAVVIILGTMAYWILEPATPVVGYHGGISSGAQVNRVADPADVITLVSATSTTASGNYASLDAPRGTTFSATGGRIFLAAIFFPAATSTVEVEVGYGNARVANSAAAPAGAVTLAHLVATQADGLQEAPMWAEVPAGKIPWVRLTGSSWAVTAKAVRIP